MADIRVMVVTVPRMLRDIIIKLLTRHDDIDVADDVRDVDELIDQMRRKPADVVVLGLEESEMPEIGRVLLDEYPEIALLGVASDGRKVFLYELRPYKVPLGEISPEELANVIQQRRSSPLPGHREERCV